jgi:hypothetical protein
MDRFADADKALGDSRNAEALQLLQTIEQKGDVDWELLWRLARANFVVGENLDGDAAKGHFYRAHEQALKAVAAQDKDANVHKWCAITIGKVGDYSDTRSKIQNSFLIKEHALKAQELNPQDATVAHILGRWCFGVANISFIERGIASALFASPPVSSWEEALEHFLRHEQLLKDKGGG